MRSYHRKTRVTLIPFIQLVSLVLVFALPVVWASQVYTSSPARYDKVVVGQGDTVWGLVAQRSAQGSDINELAYNVMNLNHLKPGAHLHPGQVLLLPRQ
ncbi:MAG: LysM peptidoglycan-binding domain-containing protein [Candidatus Eremiobacteraeota bacterium]|nr:LysM peptidoglycan-binding domain-containing protein [Candidatus Eremiobacteraeota bacterium]MBV8366398.1 LysM peptidoglycan-binding domain-containing protein [Candidatus Eremiobacteraeota bacterium]